MKEDETTGVCMTRMEDKCQQGLDEETNRKRPLSRPRRGKEGDVKMDQK